MSLRVLACATFLGALSLAGEARTQTSCELPSDYDPTRRPARDQGPSVVELGIFIVAVDRVYDVDQSFRADFFVTAEWSDPRLRGLAIHSGVDVCRFAFADIWDPELSIFNRREPGVQLGEIARVDDSGRVMVLWRFQGALRSPLELQDFPLDRQRLPISLVSVRYSPSDVELVLNEESTRRTPRPALPGWRVVSNEHTFGAMPVETATTLQGEGLVYFDYALTVERQFGYYLWRAIAPLTFIVLMSWAVFWIEPENAGIQIALASTAILTLIAFLFSLNALLPPISYLTRMDFFLFGSLVLVFASFAESIVTAILFRTDRGSHAVRLDRIARVLFPLMFLLVHAVVWTVG